jgi:hypothetical protein
LWSLRRPYAGPAPRARRVEIFDDDEQVARTARRLTGPRLFRSYYRHRAPFYRPSADGSKLRLPFLSDRYFSFAVRLLRRREKFPEPAFALLARAFNQARALHPSYLTAWVFLPDPANFAQQTKWAWFLASPELPSAPDEAEASRKLYNDPGVLPQ